MKNYNLRSNYENQVVKLSLIANEKIRNLKYLSDYQLLSKFNELLIKLNLYLQVGPLLSALTG